jgi:phosphoglycerate dehydrogenase-like enzyme
MKQILVTIGVDPAALERLKALPGVAVELRGPFEKRAELPAELLRQTHILLCKAPPQNFDELTKLQMMQIATVGYEHLADLKLGGRPYPVCNARGIFETAIGEWNIAMMVNLARDLRGMIRHQDLGIWDRAPRFQQEIRDKVVGLWGYGGIGRETARLAKVFGMKVHVMTRSGIKPRRDAYLLPGTGDPDGVLPDQVFTNDQRQAFLTGLDFLILALPRTANSTGLIGENELEALPRTAYVLNPARGAIIAEQALLKALREGWIAGAALDTHYAYPLPAEHPLWRFPNVILTPHVSGTDQSDLFPARIWDLFVQNVERFLAGKPLLNLVSAAEWAEL